MTNIAELFVRIRERVTCWCLAFLTAKKIFEAKEALPEVADHRPSPSLFALGIRSKSD